jgi:hypothetical protein
MQDHRGVRKGEGSVGSDEGVERTEGDVRERTGAQVSTHARFERAMTHPEHSRLTPSNDENPRAHGNAHTVSRAPALDTVNDCACQCMPPTLHATTPRDARTPGTSTPPPPHAHPIAPRQRHERPNDRRWTQTRDCRRMEDSVEERARRCR